MWGFLKRHVWLVRAARLSWLSVLFAAALYLCNHYWSAADGAKSWWWTLILPNAMIGFIFYLEGNRTKADHDLVIDAITERLRKGSLTEPDRKLALRCYDELRSKLHDAAVQGGPFKPGESLHLLLRGDGPEELRAILPKLHTVPSDIPELTSDQESRLAELAATDPQCARLVLQWLFLSGGESAIEKLQSDGVFKPTEEEISEYVLGILALLPGLPAAKFSQVVGYLKWRKKDLKGKMALLPKLQERLLECDDQDFEDTVAVIGGINCGRGKAALDECFETISKRDQQKRKRECIDHEISALLSAGTNC